MSEYINTLYCTIPDKRQSFSSVTSLTQKLNQTASQNNLDIVFAPALDRDGRMVITALHTEPTAAATFMLQFSHITS